MTPCPLCGGERSAILRTFDIGRLSRIWRKKVKFDPFHGWTGKAELDKLLCTRCGLAFYRPQMIGEGAFYEKLSKFEWYYESDKWEFDRAISLIAEGKPSSILEVGCGSGEFLRRIVGCADTVVGIDINQAALARAREKGLDVSDRKVGDLNATFDMIFLFQVLEHLEAPREFVAALAEKLNPGGSLILAVPNPDGFMKDLELVFLDMPPHHSTCWSESALSYLADRCGLKLARYETEPFTYEYFRSLQLNRIAQSRTWSVIKWMQMAVVLLLMPALYALRGRDQVSGQTHLVVLTKATAA